MSNSPNIPIIDVKQQNALIQSELMTSLADVFEHGYFILGPSVERFENLVADRLGVAYAIGVNSGTDAIWLTLHALGIGPGDVVLTTANTFIATVAAIVHAGATPRLVDVGSDENIDPDCVAAALTPEVKAIVAVHLRGRPAKMVELAELAASRGIFIIEDASQAFGAKLNGREVGSLGHAACFSLHPQKILGACGDAGVVTTDNAELAKQLRSLRNHGLVGRDVVNSFGHNSRLDPLQAEVLRTKLRHVDDYIAHHRVVANVYNAALSGLPITVPTENSSEHCVYYHYSIMADERDALLAHLQSAGIDARIHYPIPIHRQVAGRACEIARHGLPVTELQVSRQLSLPIFSSISEGQVATVIGATRSFYSHQ